MEHPLNTTYDRRPYPRTARTGRYSHDPITHPPDTPHDLPDTLSTLLMTDLTNPFIAIYCYLLSFIALVTATKRMGRPTIKIYPRNPL